MCSVCVGDWNTELGGSYVVVNTAKQGGRGGYLLTEKRKEEFKTRRVGYRFFVSSIT